MEGEADDMRQPHLPQQWSNLRYFTVPLAMAPMTTQTGSSLGTDLTNSAAEVALSAE